jgi:hypothetical protein
MKELNAFRLNLLTVGVEPEPLDHNKGQAVFHYSPLALRKQAHGRDDTGQKKKMSLLVTHPTLRAENVAWSFAS